MSSLSAFALIQLSVQRVYVVSNQARNWIRGIRAPRRPRGLTGCRTGVRRVPRTYSGTVPRTYSGTVPRTYPGTVPRTYPGTVPRTQ
jgi:hypothetical protein